MNDWLKVEVAQYNFAAICRGLLVWAALLWTMIPGTAAASALPEVFQGYGVGDYGTAIEPPKPLPEIALTDEQGKPFSFEQLKGQASLLFFGFTHCPHVCPSTLAMLRGVRERLPVSQADQLQIWLISVDPMRDTVEVMRDYLSNFGPGFHGARADLGELLPLFQAMGIGYSYRADETGDNYDIDHTTTIFLLNSEVGLSRVYTSPHDAVGLLRSLRQELK